MISLRLTCYIHSPELSQVIRTPRSSNQNCIVDIAKCWVGFRIVTSTDTLRLSLSSSKGVIGIKYIEGKKFASSPTSKGSPKASECQRFRFIIDQLIDFSALIMDQNLTGSTDTLRQYYGCFEILRIAGLAFLALRSFVSVSRSDSLYFRPMSDHD